MLERYARALVRHRRAALAATAVVLLVSAAGFAGLAGRMNLELFVAPGSEAQRGSDALLKDFHIADPSFAVVISAKHGTIDGPRVSAAARALEQRIAAEPQVTDVASYWASPHRGDLRSNDARRGLIVARILGDGVRRDRVFRRMTAYLHGGPAIGVRTGGDAQFVAEGSDVMRREATKAELFTAPITLAALLFVFGSVVAAVLPLGIAAVGVVGTGALLYLLSFLTPVSSFALFFTSILALGLAVDYSLFIVSRFRESLAAQDDVEEAIVITITTAGRTVMFSSIAVALALAGLLLMPLAFLRSMGLAGIGTALITGTAALVTLPALLAVLGERVNKGALRRRPPRPANPFGFWFRTATRVMRTPWRVGALVVCCLLVTTLPAAMLKPGLIDDRTFGTNTQARMTGDMLRSDFHGRLSTPISIVLPHAGPRDHAALDRYARRLTRVDGVVRVQTATGAYANGRRSPLTGARASDFYGHGATRLVVISDREPIAPAGARQVDALRAVPSPFADRLVTGVAANGKDVVDRLLARLPVALAFVALAGFLALVVQFGSLLAPAIAVLLTVLSLGTMCGLLKLLFQDGHFSRLLDFTATGTIYVNLPIVMFCFAFGLAMDYQVFVLSRIKEEFDRTGDHERSIAVGIGRSGPIISAAAVLIALVFFGTAAFSTTSFGKTLGIGLGVIVMLDAFVIRGTLVPVLLKLVGPTAWWAPRWLRRVTDRVGLAETAAAPAAAPIPKVSIT